MHIKYLCFALHFMIIILWITFSRKSIKILRLIKQMICLCMWTHKFWIKHVDSFPETVILSEVYRFECNYEFHMYNIICVSWFIGVNESIVIKSMFRLPFCWMGILYHIICYQALIDPHRTKQDGQGNACNENEKINEVNIFVFQLHHIFINKRNAVIIIFVCFTEMVREKQCIRITEIWGSCKQLLMIKRFLFCWRCLFRRIITFNWMIIASLSDRRITYNNAYSHFPLID